MKPPSFFLCLAAGILALAASSWGLAAEPLSEETLKEIVAKPHSDTPLVDALSIYPKARGYRIAMQNRQALGPTTNTEVTATEKWVDGKFIVSESKPLDRERRFAMVVEFDADSQTYRKYLLMNGRLTGYQAGTRVGGTRSVNWVDLSPGKFATGIDCLTTETHTDSTTTWQSLFFSRGVLVRTETGTATVTK